MTEAEEKIKKSCMKEILVGCSYCLGNTEVLKHVKLQK